MIPQSEKEDSDFPAEWEDTLKQIEIHLATGYPRKRLEAISGLPSSEFEALLSRSRFGASWSQRERTSKAIAELTEWLAEEAKHQQTTASGAAVTPTFQAIQGIIERARRGNKIVAITGGVGVGKSEAAKAYAAANPRTHHHPGAVRIEFKQSDRNSTAAMSKILSAMVGEYGVAYRSGHLLDDIGKAHRPGDVLLLDECNELGDAAEVIRNLRDSFQIPLVAMGNQDFDRNVYGKKSTFEALASRMLRYDFPVTTEADVDAWFVWAGLSGAALRKVAVDIAARPGANGGLRSLALLVNECRDLFPDRPIDAAMLKDIARQLGRPIQIKRAA